VGFIASDEVLDGTTGTLTVPGVAEAGVLLDVIEPAATETIVAITTLAAVEEAITDDGIGTTLTPPGVTAEDNPTEVTEDDAPDAVTPPGVAVELSAELESVPVGDEALTPPGETDVAVLEIPTDEDGVDAVTPPAVVAGLTPDTDEDAEAAETVVAPLEVVILFFVGSDSPSELYAVTA